MTIFEVRDSCPVSREGHGWQSGGLLLNDKMGYAHRFFLMLIYNVVHFQAFSPGTINPRPGKGK